MTWRSFVFLHSRLQVANYPISHSARPPSFDWSPPTAVAGLGRPEDHATLFFPQGDRPYSGIMETQPAPGESRFCPCLMLTRPRENHVGIFCIEHHQDIAFEFFRDLRSNVLVQIIVHLIHVYRPDTLERSRGGPFELNRNASLSLPFPFCLGCVRYRFEFFGLYGFRRLRGLRYPDAIGLIVRGVTGSDTTVALLSVLSTSFEGAGVSNAARLNVLRTNAANRSAAPAMLSWRTLEATGRDPDSAVRSRSSCHYGASGPMAAPEALLSPGGWPSAPPPKAR